LTFEVELSAHVCARLKQKSKWQMGKGQMGKGQCYKVVTSASLLTISKLVVKTHA
jgi:hypothetical protein